MNQYAIAVKKADQRLINITCVHPEPIEAFVFHDLPDEMVKVFTHNRNRLDLWIKDLKTAGKNFEVFGL